MSHSYRKPYSAVTGVRSAKDDKRLASRAWRRAQNRVVRMFERDLELAETIAVPARLEAAHNDVWGWGRDGRQQYNPLPVQTWDIYWVMPRDLGRTEQECIDDAIERFDRKVEYYRCISRK